jgi:hypothetical protein
MRIRSLAIVVALGLMAAALPRIALASDSITNKASGASFTMDFGLDSVTGNIRQMTLLVDPSTGLLVGSAASPFSVTSLSSSAITNPTSTLTRPANTTAYAANQLIGSSTTAGSVVVPSFAIATTAGGAIVPRLRLQTNVTTGWQGISIQVDLWTAAPTFTNGDGGAYAPATGSAGALGSYIIPLTQMGDGAVGAGPLSGANQLSMKLTSGTAVFWTAKILGAATPISGQTFNLTAEVLN